jgi:transposase
MVYKHVKTVGEKHYLYEITATWDPVKKNSVQKRQYLGPCDAFGNLQEERKRETVTVSKTFGPFWLVKHLAEESCLDTSLNDSFGNDLGNDILALAMLRCIRPVPLRQVCDQAEETFIHEMTGCGDLCSRELSRLTVSVTEECRERFFSKLYRGGDSVIFDITAFASGSERMERPEYGSDYQRLRMPQVNLGMAYSADSKMPFCYRMYPGSVSDVKTLTLMSMYVKSFGCTKAHFILDRGFFSESNLIELLDAEMGFTVPVPGNRKHFKAIISESVQKMNSENTYLFGSTVIRVYETVVKVGERKIRALSYLDEARRNDEMTTLYSKICDFERRMKDTGWHPRIHRQLVKNGDKEMLRYFSLSEGDNGIVKTERKRNAITSRENVCGRMIILTTSAERWDPVLSSYRERNDLEAEYRMLKTDIEGGVKNMRSDASADGMIFVQFVSLILRSVLAKKIRSSEKLYTKVWLPDVIGELLKLKVSKIGGHWVLNEVTKKQRELYEALNIPVPDTAAVRRLVTRN